MYASTGSVTLSAPANARRVTVVAPTTRVDVALPAESAIAEIVPQLAGLAGLASHDPTGIAEGWLLSRLGNEPFEPARSVAASGIRDGELLYLTPRSEQLPPALFDDMIEAVAHAADGLPGTWRPSTTRRTGLLVATLCLFAGLALLTWAGLPAEIAAVTTAVLTVLLLTAAGLVSRAVGDGATGALIAIIALPYSAFAALLGIAGGAGSAWADPPALLGAFGAVAVTTAVGHLVTGRGVGLFVGVGAFSLIGILAMFVAVMNATRETVIPSVAAITGALVTAIGPVLPMLALRLGRLRLPGVPADVEEFRSDRPSTKLDEVSPSTRRATACLTALHAASALTVLGCVLVLLAGNDRWHTALAAALVVSGLLRMRAPLRHRDQRLVLFGAGLLGAAALLVRIAMNGDLSDRVVLALVAVVAGVSATDFALRAPGRSPSPYWGRFYDIIEFLALAAILPLAAQVLGLYAKVRGIGG